MNDPALRFISQALLDEAGPMSEGEGERLLCIGRAGSDVADFSPPSEYERWDTTVGEFLAKKENQSGIWWIDGGWGGPPGAMHVEWFRDHWRQTGFCGMHRQAVVDDEIARFGP